MCSVRIGTFYFKASYNATTSFFITTPCNWFLLAWHLVSNHYLLNTHCPCIYGVVMKVILWFVSGYVILDWRIYCLVESLFLKILFPRFIVRFDLDQVFPVELTHLLVGVERTKVFAVRILRANQHFIRHCVQQIEQLFLLLLSFYFG